MSTIEEHRQAMHRAVARILTTWPRVLEDAAAIGFPAGRGYGSSPGGGSSILVDGERVPATGVEIAALNPGLATGWIAELYDVVTRLLGAVSPANARGVVWTPEALSRPLQRAVDHICDDWAVDDLIDLDPASPNHRRDVFGLYRLSDMAARHWPPTVKKGDQVGSVVVGDYETAEDCGLCGMPTQPGRNAAGQLLRRRIDDAVFHALAGYGHGACWWAVWRQRRQAS